MWFGPLAVLLVAGGGVAVYLRRRGPRDTAGPPLSAEERERLDALMTEASDRP
ncbi:MAG: cytochrome c-type biogenesis protein CcmH [Geminicoccaceae bacterium]